jgi:hypothetical protein
MVVEDYELFGVLRRGDDVILRDLWAQWQSRVIPAEPARKVHVENYERSRRGIIDFTDTGRKDFVMDSKFRGPEG